MVQINKNYQKLAAGYLFPEIARRVTEFQTANPDAKLIRMGIGDVTEPLPQAVRDAMKAAIDDMGTNVGFHGYGPEQGYAWLREAIVENDYKPRGCNITADELFISDGSKCDTGNILDIFGHNNTIAVTDPVYPVYVDTNVMAGHTGPANDKGQYEGLVYLPVTAENNFTAEIPSDKVDLIYLCFPNNPTGVVATKDYLKQWVDYANSHGSIILFDAAYESFIRDPDLPRSIFEIEGAETCAIEFRSFSKNAGFTGTRCAFTVIPKALERDGQSLHKLWNRRQCTKFNGNSYIIQRGAEAVYSNEGKAQVKALVDFYMENARLIREGLIAQGYNVFGGENAPYVWVKTPDGMGSWDFFDELLNTTHIVGTPGAGFGASGEGYFRISAFNSRENVTEALSRIETKLAA